LVLQILRGLLKVLPRQPAVAVFIIDFEAALWRTVAACWVPGCNNQRMHLSLQSSHLA